MKSSSIVAIVLTARLVAPQVPSSRPGNSASQLTTMNWNWPARARGTGIGQRATMYRNWRAREEGTGMAACDQGRVTGIGHLRVGEQGCICLGSALYKVYSGIRA